MDKLKYFACSDCQKVESASILCFQGRRRRHIYSNTGSDAPRTEVAWADGDNEWVLTESIFFNLSLRQAAVLTWLKSATIVPIPKKTAVRWINTNNPVRPSSPSVFHTPSNSHQGCYYSTAYQTNRSCSYNTPPYISYTPGSTRKHM